MPPSAGSAIPDQEDAKLPDKFADYIKDVLCSISPSDLINLATGFQTIRNCEEQVSFPSRVYPRTIPEIHLLPPVYNWEFTRRHPYYVQYQPLAALYFAGLGTELQAIMGSDLSGKAERAAHFLQRLGWLGPYIHPSHDLRRLAFLRQNHPPFSNPLAHPVNYGYLAARLLELPKETRKQVASILAGEGSETEGHADSEDLTPGLVALQRIPGPALDGPLPELLFIAPEASEKGVVDAVRLVLRHLKSQPDALPKRRLSEAQLDEYLQVWDLREGWANGQYDWKRTKRFREIALETGTPEGTVKNRYRAAFRYITGHDYTPNLFAALFGPLACHQSKWAGWRRSKQRRGETGSRWVVTNTAGSRDKDGRDSSILDRQSAESYDPQEWIDLKTDIQDLVQRGRSSEQIAAELEMSVADAAALIEWFRTQASEDL